MFERPRSGERAAIVHITLHQFREQPALAEFIELAHSAQVIVAAQLTGTRQLPDAHTFIGSGKLAELQALVVAEKIEVILFNHTLSPSQERNLERELKCRVVDRTGVILDIFAQRAQSFEGQLQVELAQLKHLSTRLVRGWTHLERQRGGIGLRGPGETQLETDRRLLGERIKQIGKELVKVREQREQSRRARQRAEIPVIALVGYTNAGKSTLFNHLTHAKVYAANQLFATLDTTLRRIELSSKLPVILADTVGFIQQLPHDLVAAFRATLDETRLATILLHVVDASDPERQAHIEQVNQVLTEIEADKVPQIMVYNKIDCLPEISPHLEEDETGKPCKVWLSAQTGQGLDLLKQSLENYLSQETTHQWLRVPATAGQLRARIFTSGHVLHESYADNGDSLLEVELPTRYFKQLLASEPALETLHHAC